MQSKAILMDSEVVGRTLKRLSYEIVEKTDNLDDLVLVGIRTRGVPICQTLAQNIKQAMGHEVPMGELDITLYRDDLSAIDAAPVLNGTKIDFDLTGMGYDLCIVNTGGSHADLNDDYASIPAEMKAVASFFGKEVLRIGRSAFPGRHRILAPLLLFFEIRFFLIRRH